METADSSSAFSKVLRYAFLLLKYRQRSTYELRQRLVRKRFSPEAVSSVISFLNEKKFLDDEQFARAWSESRISRSLGPRKIRQELVLKGVDKRVINRCLHEWEEPSAQYERIQSLAQARLKRLKGVKPITASRRISAYLIRRGFSPETVWEVVSELVKA